MVFAYARYRVFIAIKLTHSRKTWSISKFIGSAFLRLIFVHLCLHSSQGPNLKTTVTGVEMFKKQLDQGQVNLFKHELSLYGATVKIKDKKDLCVFPIYEALATSRKSVYQIATQLSIIADPVESKNLSECVKDIFTLERASFFGCGSYLVQLSFSSWS